MRTISQFFTYSWISYIETWVLATKRIASLEGDSYYRSSLGLQGVRSSWFPAEHLRETLSR